jgi:hypothetical protein
MSSRTKNSNFIFGCKGGYMPVSERVHPIILTGFVE